MTIDPQHASPHTTTFRVTGMNCGHCVNAVTEEIGGLAGVHAVSADLPSGVVAVASAEPLDPAALAIAIHDAGCEPVL